jgi:hypothetical protein
LAVSPGDEAGRDPHHTGRPFPPRAGGDLEHNSLWRRSPDGTYRTLAQGSDLLWIDTLSIASDRHLYAIANQLNRLSPFHEGQDLRRKPYLLVRLPIDAGPVRLV